MLVLALLVPRPSNPIYGGYCGGVPPLPIPNREVKPACADGTAMRCGRVGGRLFSSCRVLARIVLVGTLFLLAWLVAGEIWEDWEKWGAHKAGDGQAYRMRRLRCDKEA